MSREPLHDLTGRQYGESINGVAVRPCWGEDLEMISYEAPKESGDDYNRHWKAFAADVRAGNYNGRMIYSVTSHWDEYNDRYSLAVMCSKIESGTYSWGNAGTG